MKNINFKLSERLYHKLSDLRLNLSKLEKVSVSFSDMIEEALLSFYKIRLTDIGAHKNDNITDAVIVGKNDDDIFIDRSGTYFVFMYLNKRKPINMVVGDVYVEYEPFYVGIGESHILIDAPIAMTQRKIDELNETDDFDVVKIMEGVDELTAFRFQQALIYIFGRLNNGTGCLYNKKEGDVNTIKKDFVDGMIQTYKNMGYSAKTIAEKMNISERTVYRKFTEK